ncbi:MAG: sulfite exporter TauE/SafE family protein [Chitinispirillales bacterium]|jgi:sulfite exporter TauE/SafE|nr:sulfite exporter TauE/SafE family protein [Chitinispirillales bacterium]
MEKKIKTDKLRALGLLVIVFALYVILERFGIMHLLSADLKIADETMGYGMLFIIGLVTSVHCISMCGGINLSQCIPQGKADGGSRSSTFAPSILYNLGRVVSCTAVGFAVGGLGSALTPTSIMQGAVKLTAGVFMIIMGINMMGIFPWLRKFNPRMPKFFTAKINNDNRQGKGPLIVGLLNGFMPCGPLQAMQLYALSTGSPVKGAIAMFLFSAGTVPLMFGLGAFSSAMGKKFTGKAMTAGAVLVAVLGLTMLTQGLNPLGITVDFSAGTSSSVKDAVIEDNVQIVKSTLSGRSYPSITVKAGTPVKWIIDAPQGSINGCNNRIFIKEYGIEHTFKLGENIINFTPDKTGTFGYACWMDMIRSTVNVVE